MQSCGADTDWRAFCIHAKKLIKDHQGAINTFQHVSFDLETFGYSLHHSVGGGSIPAVPIARNP